MASNVIPNISADAVEEAKAFAAGIVNPPEPVETPIELDTETLLKVSVSPEIAAALAAEGLIIDQDAVNDVIADSEQHEIVEAESTPEIEAEYVTETEPVELVDVTPELIRDFKEEVNASFEEIATILGEQQRQINEIEARLAEHNRRGGHKI